MDETNETIHQAERTRQLHKLSNLSSGTGSCWLEVSRDTRQPVFRGLNLDIFPFGKKPPRATPVVNIFFQNEPENLPCTMLSQALLQGAIQDIKGGGPNSSCAVRGINGDSRSDSIFPCAPRARQREQQTRKGVAAALGLDISNHYRLIA